MGKLELRSAFVRHYLRNLGRVVKFDILGAARCEVCLEQMSQLGAASDGHMFFGADAAHKCDFLLLRLESSMSWESILRAHGFPLLSFKKGALRVRTLHWTAPYYKEFLNTLVYSRVEMAFLCRLDVLCLPFYTSMYSECSDMFNVSYLPLCADRNEDGPRFRTSSSGS